VAVVGEHERCFDVRSNFILERKERHESKIVDQNVPLFLSLEPIPVSVHPLESVQRVVFISIKDGSVALRAELSIHDAGNDVVLFIV
jgi:hypothetical protein